MSAGLVHAAEMAFPKPADAKVAARVYEGVWVGGGGGVEGLCWGWEATATAWSGVRAEVGVLLDIVSNPCATSERSIESKDGYGGEEANVGKITQRVQLEMMTGHERAIISAF